MADETQLALITESWERFARSLRTIGDKLADGSEDDPFVRVRSDAFDLAESPEMIEEFESAYRDAPSSAAANVLITEMDAFAQTVERYAGAKEENFGKRVWRVLKSGGKTVLGSVADIFKMSDKGKAIIALGGEALDLTEVSVLLAGEDQ